MEVTDYFLWYKFKTVVILASGGCMKKLKLFVVLFLCAFAPSGSIADVPSEQVGEVAHLLAYVKNSGCVINRNGTKHPANEGVDHIKKKYDYFKGDINSTENFIELAAAKSTMSGKYYMVTCSGKAAIKNKRLVAGRIKKISRNK